MAEWADALVRPIEAGLPRHHGLHPGAQRLLRAVRRKNLAMTNVVLFVCVLVLASWRSLASQSYEAENLRDFDSVRVVIEDVDVEAIAAGLSEHQLRTKVELELRKAGIPVFTSDGGVPALYVSVNVLQTSSGGFVFCVSVEVWARYLRPTALRGTFARFAAAGDSLASEAVVYRTDLMDAISGMRLVTIWDAATVGTTGRSGSDTYIYQSVIDLTESFMNDWLAVH